MIIFYNQNSFDPTYQQSQMDPRDVLLDAHRAVRRGGRSV